MEPKSRLERILQHRAVSRAMMVEGASSPGLDVLVKLRKTRRDVKRANRNAAEDVRVSGAHTYSPQALTQRDPKPALRAALEAGGLPKDLREAIEREIA